MTYQLTRRRAIQLGALGVVSTAAGAVGLWRTTSSRDELPVTRDGQELAMPEVLASEGGLLRVPLEAAAGVRLAGRDTSALAYNGTSPGPTLRLRPGDTLRIDLANRLDEPTNLHVHGLHVSPEGNGDNVFIEVAPGETFHYEYRLPDDHPTGTFWYHPHRHGLVADQVFGGLAGAIIVADDDAAEGPFDEDRLLVVTDTTLDEAGRVVQPTFRRRMMGREGRLLMVNGQVQPVLTARRNARERWRVVNACSSRFLRLRLDRTDFLVLGLDGGPAPQPRRQEEVLLAPGNRADLAVEVASEGRYQLLTEAYDRGGTGPMMGGGMTSERALLAVVDVDAESAPSGPLQWDATEPEDLREATVDEQRELVFDVGMGGGRGMRFLIDGREFDPDRVDTEVRLGAVEEWVLRNPSPMDHPFHLHVWPFQVLDQGDGPVPEPEWRDVINIPAGGEVLIRVRFADFGGRTVYHCHILDHEDLGMMGVIVAS
ncbi:MAG: multicopper oxidase family protein [Actinomycetota bacterium]